MEEERRIRQKADVAIIFPAFRRLGSGVPASKRERSRGIKPRVRAYNNTQISVVWGMLGPGGRILHRIGRATAAARQAPLPYMP